MKRIASHFAAGSCFLLLLVAGCASPGLTALMTEDRVNSPVAGKHSSDGWVARSMPPTAARPAANQDDSHDAIVGTPEKVWERDDAVRQAIEMIESAVASESSEFVDNVVVTDVEDVEPHSTPDISEARENDLSSVEPLQLVVGLELNDPVPIDQPSVHDDPDTELIEPGPAASDEVAAHPVDLANALAMAGASHIQVQLARQRTVEAHADYVSAKVMWLPSIRAGVGWNRHNGKIQATEGDIVEVSRESLFVGGGAGIGNASLTGGAGGPARLTVNLSLADALFAKHVAAWNVAAREADEAVALNDAQLAIAQAYLDLLEAHGQIANTQLGYDLADDLVELTELFEMEGAGTAAEVDRAVTARLQFQQLVQDARRRADVASAGLARQLRFDPNQTLVPADLQVLPLEMVDADVSRDVLVQQATTMRPELSRAAAVVDAEKWRTQQECWRPWLPNLVAGASGGGFGGGPSHRWDDLGDRTDFDAAAVWEVRNLGFGDHAAHAKAYSRLEQARWELDGTRDQVAAQVVAAHSNVLSYRRQMQTGAKAIQVAQSSYERNFDIVKNAKGRPIELLQAIQARVDSLNSYTTATANYNRAQYELLRALGSPAWACE